MDACMHGARHGGQGLCMLGKYPTTELHLLLAFPFLYLPVAQSLFSFNPRPAKQCSTRRDPGTLMVFVRVKGTLEKCR